MGIKNQANIASFNPPACGPGAAGSVLLALRLDMSAKLEQKPAN